jgi:hypothetical protein
VGEDRTDRPGANQRRVTVAEASDLLGISEGAVRMRVKRRTLPSTRKGGQLYILLNIDPTPEPERPHDGTHDRTSELIDTLREQLEAERQAHAEARRIIAGLVERIPAIEAPSEARGSPQTVEEEPERAEHRPGAGEAQEGVQRSTGRSLWRRIFGG